MTDRNAPRRRPRIPQGALPRINRRFESSVRGVYIIGDLANSPVIKTAVNQGVELIEQLAALPDARTGNDDVYDVLICGAGAAGLSAALAAKDAGLRYLVIDKRDYASTIQDFSRGKPIFAEPDAVEARGRLWIADCTREELLERWDAILREEQLRIQTHEEVQSLRRTGDEIAVTTDKATYLARRVILAIGKRGNPRKLGAPGEHLPKVHYKLTDPSDYAGRRVLVVGGGDSAVENALALADLADVTLSYRKGELARVKARNSDRVHQAIADGRVRAIWNSTVREIREDAVVIDTGEGETVLGNDAVFVQIGADQPVDFLLDAGIEFEGQRNGRWWATLAAASLLSWFVYSLSKSKGIEPINALGRWLGQDALIGNDGALTRGLSFANFAEAREMGLLAAYHGLVFAVMGLLVVLALWRRADRWKYLSMALGLGAFQAIFTIAGQFGRDTQGAAPYTPSYWYTILYCILMVVFGIEAMWRWKHSRYQLWRYASLILFQVFFFFILPEVIMRLAYAGTPERWDYWRWYGVFYAWPLFWNTFFDAPLGFVIWGLVLTFVLMPILVLFHGKRYCTWICGCGGLAETLGDRWRHKAPKGERAIAWEKMNLVVLIIAVSITVLHVAKVHLLGDPAGSLFVDPFLHAISGGRDLRTYDLVNAYSWIVDYLLVGVIPVAVYPILGGKIWCRYWCPLAKYMEILSRAFGKLGWSRFGIRSNEHCISCGQCTRYCQVGIDVQHFAQRREVLDNTNSSCIGCGICLDVCPVNVLSFGVRPESATAERPDGSAS